MHSLLTLGLGATVDGGVAFWLVLAADLLALATVPSVLLSRSGRPLAALSWLLALLAVPFGGVLAWWLLGRTHLARQRRRRQAASDRLCDRCEPVRCEPGALRALDDVVPFAGPDSRWTDGVFPAVEAEDLTLLRTGAEAFTALREVIAQARCEIRLLFYIWEDDAVGREISEDLIGRARAGVRVRVLVDAVGSARFLRRRAPAMRRAGVEVVGFLPARFRPWSPTFNFRNHRKLLVADSAVAVTGGMNIGTVYAVDWRELACRLGGAVVAHLDAVFEEDWHFASGAEIGRCMVDSMFLALRRARRRVWLLTPYFIPEAATLAALRGAAQRGADVRLILPRRNDVPLVRWASRSYYAALLEAGVRIFEYLPAVSHAKALIVDEDLVILGSPNVDIRSFRLNFELACFIAAPELNRQLEVLMQGDLDASAEVTQQSGPRATSKRLLESAAHLLSPLL